MATLAETNVKAARDEGLSEVIADVVGLEVDAVEARMEEAHGRTRLDTLFADEWPVVAADFEGSVPLSTSFQAVAGARPE